MQNVAFKVEDGKLIVTVDLTAPGTPSSTGKTTIIGSTRGYAPVNPGVYLVLNVLKKPSEKGA